VRAAQALVPGWVERGAGCFVSTASAAGLLTQLGSPTYSVTKHAAVGFAEWLAATYGDQGLQVCCLCPMGVRTGMLDAGETSQDETARLATRSVVTAGATVTPLDVADVLLSALAEGTFFALPHPEVGQMYARKAAGPDHWIAGMQRFRAGLEG
jgi:NAD(P)-dependent dehydrogenase (short-subunit alcohol dehydrogenase family)